jgi:hypothetical protein
VFLRAPRRGFRFPPLHAMPLPWMAVQPTVHRRLQQGQEEERKGSHVLVVRLLDAETGSVPAAAASPRGRRKRWAAARPPFTHILV